MHDSRLFRRRLAARVLGILGAASLSLPSGCGSDDGGGAAGGGSPSSGATTSGAAAGGAPSGSASSDATTSASTTSGSTTSAGGGAAAGSGGSPAADAGGPSSGVTQCFDWSPDAGSCPTDGNVVIYELTSGVCPTSGWDPYKIDSGPKTNAAGQCCYVVELELCVNGGRPFLVEERARVAPAERSAGRRGWDAHDMAAPCVEGLDAGARAALAETWTALALLEHASVASFARVSLQLLAVGAPADLVSATHQAALDEIRHARLCFALASAYAGDQIAPGPFPLGDGLNMGSSLAELAASTVKEGCVGETVAAVVAAEQLARATDPAVRAALEEIAADEARHAELAWRTVAWAMREGGSEVRDAVERALGDALAAGATAVGGGCVGPELSAHGRLGSAAMRTAAAGALSEVVAPAAAALLRAGGANA
jgi:hypothetical protein